MILQSQRGAMTRLLLALALLATVSCGDGGPGTPTGPDPDPEPTPAALRLAPDAPVFRIGETATLDVVILDDDGEPIPGAGGTVAWSSSDSSVVDVDGDGVLRALAVGSATIRAESEGVSGTAEATVRAPEPVSGSSNPVSAVIDSAGGSITATAEDGTAYTLTVPARAVAEPVEITLTPLADVEHFPMTSGLSAGVLLEPHGLAFGVPVELAIVATAPFAAGQAGFTQSEDAFGLIPALVSADTARLVLHHFSSAGTGAPTTAEAEAVAPPASDTQDRARHDLAVELSRASAAEEHPDPATLEGILRGWYEAGVKPGFEAVVEAPSPEAEAVEAAIADWLRWWGDVSLVTVVEDLLADAVAEARALARSALLATMDRMNQECVATQDPEYAFRVLELAGTAAYLGLDGEGTGLSLEEVTEDLCVQVVVAESAVPEPFEDGATLTVRAGLSYGGGAPVFDTPLDVQLESADATLSPAAGQTDGEGRFEATVELDAEADSAWIQVVANYPGTERLQAADSLLVKRAVGAINVLDVRSFRRLVVFAGSGTEFENFNEEDLSQELGPFSGSYAFEATAGSFNASGRVDQDAEITAVDDTILLRVATNALVEGSTTADVEHVPGEVQGGSANVRAYANAGVTFEVVGGPVYYQANIAGLRRGQAEGLAELKENTEFYSGGYNMRYLAQVSWEVDGAPLDEDVERSAVASGWLDPGVYFAGVYAWVDDQYTDDAYAGRVEYDISFVFSTKALP